MDGWAAGGHRCVDGTRWMRGCARWVRLCGCCPCLIPPLSLLLLPAHHHLCPLSACSQVREANQMVEEMMLLANCTGKEER